MAFIVGAIAFGLGFSPAQAAPAAQESDPNTLDSQIKNAIDFIMYLRSQPHDDDSCTMAVQDGQLVSDPSITNPAMSCPDMFAWKLFIESLQQEFWRNWAADQYTWPQDGPLPLCPVDAPNGSACCTIGSTTNPGYDDADNPGRVCPYYPGDNLAADEEPDTLETNEMAVAQDSHFEAPIPAEGVEPGRVIRQQMAEVVFRNKPMFDYIFENDLYNTDGLAAVFQRAGDAIHNGAPYRAQDGADGLVTINLPINSVMIKTNWINEARAAELGIVDDPAHPYIKMMLNSKVIDNNAEIFEPGIHYLVAFHISSKDVPNWTWATFEHVDNPGRCDMIGCNDAFGYRSADAIPSGHYQNFIAPKQQSDNLLLPTTIFDEGQSYQGDEPSAALSGIFAALGIGSRDGDDNMPALTDRAWLSYRLKGTQTAFNDSIGQPILNGNSVTEGGFVTSSSCMSCHARAAIGSDGSAALAVFESRLAEDGYAQSTNGAPDPDWFFSSASEPSLTALPFDFVWGILFARPLAAEAGNADDGAALESADPFAYCATVGAIDTPEGDFGGASNPGVPAAVAAGLQRAMGLSGDAPVAQNSYWRCMDGQVYACFVGANLPCDSKANIDDTPTDAMNAFCVEQPDADAIPTAVTGHDTIYAWSCVDGKAQAGEQLFQVDAQGYATDFWYEVDPTGDSSSESAEPEAPSALVGVTWQLAEIAHADDRVDTSADPAQYMLLLAADGTLSAQSDCNRARGSYELDGEAISIGPLTSTAALCPPESLSEAYVKGLTTAATYAIADGELSIHFGPDEGVMHFMMAP
ncbi:MAG: META domain-containing protein [Caldilineaceae bacterium]|nr:META domain-containing protein [Caldilineaceae bacterium]